MDNYWFTCVNCFGTGIKSIFKQKNAVYLARLCMCKGAFKTISTDREIVELPVESSEVQLQCVFLSLCGSPGSQVFPVKILPVV